MLSRTRLSLKDSIATQLLGIVFSFYVIVTFTLTGIHMVAEYYNAKDRLIQELKGMETTLLPGVAKAIWNVDEGQLKSLMEGILESPLVIGTKVEREAQTSLSAGKTDTANEGNDAFLISISNSIVYEEFGEVSTIGHLTLYSSREIVINKVWQSYLFIVINSILKTAALWIIFLIVSRKYLTRPLAHLTQSTLELDLEQLETFHMKDLPTQQHNELKILQEAFREMVQKLLNARQKLQAAERQAVELQTAQSIQELLIPNEDPQLEEVEIASFYQSASETGGDWYGFRHHADLNTLDVLVGDVTGHGVPAALITAIVDSFYQSLDQHRLEQSKAGEKDPRLLEPTYLLELLNNVLYSTTQGLYNMTFFYSMIDLQKKSLTYASAAHDSLYIWRPSQFTFTRRGQEKKRAILDLNIPGPRLGHAANNQYSIASHPLQKDDVLVWYTDGLVENKNSEGEPFATRNLKKILKQCQGLSAEAIKDRIVEAAYQHYGTVPRADDVTVIVGRIR